VRITKRTCIVLVANRNLTSQCSGACARLFGEPVSRYAAGRRRIATWHRDHWEILEGAVPRDRDVSEYGRQSLWRDTAGADAAKARELAGRLELRAKAEDEVDARETYLDLLGITAGERVLDVGCGSGVVTREIARRVGPRGRAVGLDPSPALLTVARELAQEADLGDRIEFREGSALRPGPQAGLRPSATAEPSKHPRASATSGDAQTRACRH